jgi:hypothetical protein
MFFFRICNVGGGGGLHLLKQFNLEQEAVKIRAEEKFELFLQEPGSIPHLSGYVTAGIVQTV